jgi:Tfp pilus assembly protein PilF
MKVLSFALGVAVIAIPATPAFGSALSLNKSLAAACFESARDNRRDWDAIRVCDLALSEELMTRDTRVATLVNRAILRMRQGDTQIATGDFNKALALEPTEPEIWLNMGLAQLDAGNGSVAAQMADRALELRTEQPAVAYYVRGLAREMGGDLNSAYADLVRARNLAPEWDQPALELTRYRVTRR